MTANNETGAPGIPRPRYPSAFNSRLSIGTLMSQGKFEYRQASAIAEMMRQAMEKQTVDEETNYRWIEDRLGGGGNRTATRVIAASNAYQTSKDGADYVCDGIDDHVEIQQAIEDLYAGGYDGGLIFLTEGEFILGNTVEVTDGLNDSPFTFMGTGWGTIVYMSDATGEQWNDLDALFYSSGSGVRFTNFRIIGTDGNNDFGHALILVDGGDAIVDNMWGEDVGQEFLASYGAFKLRVHDNIMYGFSQNDPGYILDLNLAGSSFFESDEVFIQGNLIAGDNFAMRVSGGSDYPDASNIYISIVGNGFYGELNLENLVFFNVANNFLDFFDCTMRHCYFGTVSGNTFPDILASDLHQVAFSGNHGGIELLDSRHCSFVGELWFQSGSSGSHSVNTFENCQSILITGCKVGWQDNASFGLTLAPFGHLLTLDSCDDITVVGCEFSTNFADATPLTPPHNTYDGLHITNDTNNCNVQCNTVRSYGTGQLRHAMRIDNANCDNNLVTNNDMRNSGATTSGLSDAGTGTITTAGNH